jgi:hypothetical protein
LKSQPIARLASSCRIDSATILVLIAVLLLGAVATATLLWRTHLARLTGLIALAAFLALLTRSRSAALLILTDLVLTLLLVTLRRLLLLVAIGIAASLRSAIPILRIVTLVRHESLLELAR